MAANKKNLYKLFPFLCPFDFQKESCQLFKILMAQSITNHLKYAHNILRDKFKAISWLLNVNKLPKCRFLRKKSFGGAYELRDAKKSHMSLEYWHSRLYSWLEWKV